MKAYVFRGSQDFENLSGIKKVEIIQEVDYSEIYNFIINIYN